MFQPTPARGVGAPQGRRPDDITKTTGTEPKLHPVWARPGGWVGTIPGLESRPQATRLDPMTPQREDCSLEFLPSVSLPYPQQLCQEPI